MAVIVSGFGRAGGRGQRGGLDPHGRRGQRRPTAGAGSTQAGGTPYNDYLDAEVIVTSGFANGRLEMCLSPEDLVDWSSALLPAGREHLQRPGRPAGDRGLLRGVPAGWLAGRARSRQGRPLAARYRDSDRDRQPVLGARTDRHGEGRQ
ncbi:DUF5959 family protein [Streptomyces virginiae]|uniref:DUF5959 family protein n=1 Tax=Streptomyces virginiae TaxID=1961 RepID=UPI00371492AC